MAFNSSNQISFLILDSLSNGSKYGLEIIEFISQKTGGNYILKKPTLYSCLTRMEKKGFVSSSYWGESELGGKRHYYNITNEGKRELERLSSEFDYATAQNENEQSQNTAPSLANANSESSIETKSQPEENKQVILHQDNLFDMVKPNAKNEKPLEVDDESDVLKNQIDIFSFQETLPKEQTSTPNSSQNETTQDDGKLLEETEKLTEYQEEQNRRIYDTSNDLKKYRKRKSFSENQIEMAVVYENEEEKEAQKTRIEQLKQSMLNVRQNAYEQINKPTAPITREEPSISTELQNKPQPDTNTALNDDAVFITERMSPSEVPIQKKISPTNIEVNFYDDNLPAPKRDTNLEPTYKDMIAKLFERKKEKQKEPVVAPIIEENTPQTFADYSSLKKYYSGHGIEFKEYKKSNVERRHNTNLLNFINSSILFLLSGIFSAIIFAIVCTTNNLMTATNFMYYTLPVLFAIYTIYEGIKFKIIPSKKPALKYNALTCWIIFALAVIIILVSNILCGMNNDFSIYLTSLLLPSIAVFLAFPVNHHVKKFLYNKYGK